MSRPEEPIRVALAGCGAVGGAFAALKSRVGRVGNDPVQLTRVLVKRRGEVRPVWPRSVTLDLDEFLGSNAEVVVEAIGGLEPALTIARHVLGRGGALITANKALVRAHGVELTALANESGGWLGFEAAVGGGVPMVRAVREAAALGAPESLRGIFNGTANYVLSRLEAGETLAAAVAAARARGLAEADVSRDLDGRDVADKLAVLAWVAWGVDPREVAVSRRGLLPDPAALVAAARATGGRLRLVGACQRTPDGIVATVRPEVVAPDSALGQTVGEQNRLVVNLGWAAPLELAGPGAGGVPTAAALWSDLREWHAARRGWVTA